MKNSLWIVLIIFCSLSCKKKFEEGPGFSIKSANKRIKGNWELQTFSINGIDSTQYYNTVFKEKCRFSITPPHRNGDNGTIFITWGHDTTDIIITRLWPGYPKSGEIVANAETDLSLSYTLYPFCQCWYSKSFDIRHLTTEKMILQISSNESSIQRLEFKKL